MWELSFDLMTLILIHDNPDEKSNLRQMLRLDRNIFELIVIVLVLIAINWWPISVLFILGLNISSKRKSSAS